MCKQSFFDGRRAFTLVEMLVVIAIISMVATASVSSIKSAQRQARSAKCQANMHALYNAAAAYHADKGSWPAAGSYEVYDGRSDKYYQFRGWVTWVRSGSDKSSRSRPGDSGNLYKDGNNNRDGAKDASQASKYYYVGTGAPGSDEVNLTDKNYNYTRVYRSIDEGSIFRYADKNFAAYCCDEFKSRYGKGSLRSYAMNQRFGSRRYRRNPLWKETPSDNGDRLAMFVELGRADLKTKKPTVSSELGSNVAKDKNGTRGDDTSPSNTFSDDSVWDWDKNVGSGDSSSGANGSGGENFGVMHRKSGKTFGNVIFADGHLESLELPKSSSDQQKLRLSFGAGVLSTK